MSHQATIPSENQLILSIRKLAGDTPVYLVGGAIRDRLLGRKRRDLDFSLGEEQVRPLARKVANSYKGSFYVLDEKRNAARVILGSNAQRMVLDFAAFRGGTLESDLYGRDFTINSMAVEIHQPEKMIDPLHGARHLKDKTLKPCGPSAFQDDPVRAMRAIRMCVSFGLRMDEETTGLLRRSVDKLGDVSIERRRDELFHLLESPRVATSIRLLDHFQMLPFILPGLAASKGVSWDSPIHDDQFEYSLAVTDYLERLYFILVEPYQEEIASSSIASSSVVLHLGRFRENLAHHFTQRLVVDRSRFGLLMFACLGSPPEKQTLKPLEVARSDHVEMKDRARSTMAADRGRGLALSRSEENLIRSVIACFPEVHALAKKGGDLSQRDIFRYFRGARHYGVDACLLALADLHASYMEKLPQETWIDELAAVRALLTGWFEQRTQVIDPPLLLNGDDLMELYHLKPGPLIGTALAHLREAQACGEVNSRVEAMANFEDWWNTYQAEMRGAEVDGKTH